MSCWITAAMVIGVDIDHKHAFNNSSLTCDSEMQQGTPTNETPGKAHNAMQVSGQPIVRQDNQFYHLDNGTRLVTGTCTRVHTLLISVPWPVAARTSSA